MKKRRTLLLMAIMVFMLPILLMPKKFVAASEQVQVNIHYHRYDGDYDGWNIWSWIGGMEGASYEFNGEDEFGMIATYTMEIDEGTEEIGFIVRYSTESNAWEQKDCTEDRFINLSYAKDGTIDIYLVQGESKFGYGEDEMNIGPKIMEAYFTDAQTIEFKVSAAFDSTDNGVISKITVKDKDGKAYQISDIFSEQGADATMAVLTMQERAPIAGNYTLEFEGYGSLAISSNRLFNTEEFENTFYYNGDDLGANWTKEKTAFRLWAPTASEVILNLYETGNGNDRLKVFLQ